MARQVLRRYLTADEAQLARAQLEAVGIDATVAHDTVSRALPFLGAAEGIPLEVEEEDATRAMDVLGEPAEITEAVRAAHPELAPESRVLPRDAQKTASRDAAARAFKASIIGVFLCPGVLHLYALWLLRRPLRDWAMLPSGGRRYAVAAGLISAIVLVGVVAAFITVSQ